jgi:hypothetical protein
VARGNPQPLTHSPAGDISHGFPAPQPWVGGPDHLVFLPEDKFVHDCQSRWADLNRLPPYSTLGVVVRLEAKVEAVFVLTPQSGQGGGVEFHGKSASNQRQYNKRKIYHASPKAASMPPPKRGQRRPPACYLPSTETVHLVHDWRRTPCRHLHGDTVNGPFSIWHWVLANSRVAVPRQALGSSWFV